MYSKIIVPLDGSGFGECALPAAEALARSLGIRVLLLQVIPYPQVTDASFVGGREKEALEYLRRISRELGERGVEADVEVPWGDVVDSIVKYAEAERAPLLVMASHGRTGVTKLAFGSVAEAVLRRARSISTLICRCPHPGEAA